MDKTVVHKTLFISGEMMKKLFNIFIIHMFTCGSSSKRGASWFPDPEFFQATKGPMMVNSEATKAMMAMPFNGKARINKSIPTLPS